MSAKRIFQLLALLFTMAFVAAVVWLMTQKNSPLYQPINNYELVSALNQVSKNDVDDAVTAYLGLSFWEIPLNKIQADLTRLDWIKAAEVKRQWPNVLYISITEQKPIARWNDDGLINGHGEVFFPQHFDEFKNLVKLQGDLQDSNVILEQLIHFQKQFDSLEMTIARLNYNDQVWRLFMVNELEIVVDSEAYNKKIARFVRAYPKVDDELRKSARIYDLRYSNGFIVANK